MTKCIVTSILGFTALAVLGSRTLLLTGCKVRKPAQKAAEAAAPTFVNDRCPVTGEAIDPAKVPADLTREFKGQKVAFCCSMCPPQWDRLSDQEKQAKLDKVLAPGKSLEPK